MTTRRSPAAVTSELHGFQVVDARQGSALDDPELLPDAIVSRSDVSRRDLIVIDAFEELIERWGPDGAWRFFSRTCPRLLGPGDRALVDLRSRRRDLRRRMAR